VSKRINKEIKKRKEKEVLSQPDPAADKEGYETGENQYIYPPNRILFVPT
jgi:hypothetical protein